MPRPRNPWELPDASRYVRHAFRLYRALAAVDPAVPRTLGVCRAAALRFLEVVRAQGYGHRTALRLLLAASAQWSRDTLSPAERDALDRRLRFWVGSAYGLRWQDAEADAPAANGTPPGEDGRRAAGPPPTA